MVKIWRFCPLVKTGLDSLSFTKLFCAYIVDRYNRNCTLLLVKYLRESVSTVTQRFNQTEPSLVMLLFSLHHYQQFMIITIIITMYLRQQYQQIFNKPNQITIKHMTSVHSVQVNEMTESDIAASVK